MAEARKRAILLVAFGSSLPEGEAAIADMRAAVARAFPTVEVRTAYTSRFIVRKLVREGRRDVAEPLSALARLATEGFPEVAVLSAHIIPGAEYRDLEAVVDGFRLMSQRGAKAGFRSVGLTPPLLSDAGDFDRLAAALAARYAREAEDGAVVFVGHGSHHFADAAYAALQMALRRVSPHFLVGAIEGSPSLEDVLVNLKRTGRKRVTLVPAMLVAGDHARNDIAGDGDASWRSAIAAEGCEVAPILRGLGSEPFVQQWLTERARRLWDEMDAAAHCCA
jgi:Cobalamin biosynthesis protein CbiK, Co2+ chelatase